MSNSLKATSSWRHRVFFCREINSKKGEISSAFATVTGASLLTEVDMWSVCEAGGGGTPRPLTPPPALRHGPYAHWQMWLTGADFPVVGDSLLATPPTFMTQDHAHCLDCEGANFFIFFNFILFNNSTETLRLVRLPTFSTNSMWTVKQLQCEVLSCFLLFFYIMWLSGIQITHPCGEWKLLSGTSDCMVFAFPEISNKYK